MSKKKSAKASGRPEADDAAVDGNGNGRHDSSGGGNGADRVGETPHPAANGGADDAEARREQEMEEEMELLPERIRGQLRAIRQRSQEAQELSREARDSYETARKTLQQMQKDSEARLRALEEKVERMSEEYRKQVEQARQLAEEYREHILRLRAELENLRKRHARQLDEARKYAVESFAEGACEVRDCLEAALQAAPAGPDNADDEGGGADDGPGDAAALREGVRLTLRKLNAVLTAHGIRPVVPAPGERFDPAVHQAVAKAADAVQPKNTVVAVVRPGYTIHDRTLRPADIVVSIRARPDPAKPAPGKKSGGGKARRRGA